MKMIIEIDEKFFKALPEEFYGKDEVSTGLVNEILIAVIRGKPLPEKWRLIADDELEKMIVVRKNATNGDVIKAMFPNREVFDGYAVVYYDHIRVDKLFWNAPYKAESEDKE